MSVRQRDDLVDEGDGEGGARREVWGTVWMAFRELFGFVVSSTVAMHISHRFVVLALIRFIMNTSDVKFPSSSVINRFVFSSRPISEYGGAHVRLVAWLCVDLARRYRCGYFAEMMDLPSASLVVRLSLSF